MRRVSGTATGSDQSNVIFRSRVKGCARALVATIFAVLAAGGCGSTTSNGHSNGSGGVSGATAGTSGGVMAKGGRAGASGGAHATGGVSAAAGDGGAEPDPITSGGARVGSGGTSSFGGGNFAGSGGSAGNAGNVGNAGKGGAADGCLEGAPCNCGSLVGTTQCTNGPLACSCPPEEQCSTLPGKPCFEPCGGDPFGSWVLVDSCFKTSFVGAGTACQRFVQATPNGSDLRLRILDGGAFEYRGGERWSVTLSATLSCLVLDSVKGCDGSTIGVNPFMFSSGGRLKCKASACGVCDCAGDVEGVHSLVKDSWTRDGNTLRIGGERFSYCVNGDELWIGGSDEDSPTGAYKFKKQSCSGTPTKSCAERSKDECQSSLGCKIGACEPLPFSTVTTCPSIVSETACSSSPECQWVYGECSGSVQCQFANCDTEPGCSWGEPKQHCGGMSQQYCAELDAKSCLVDHGCTLRTCYSSADEDCRRLDAAECAKAPGCTAADPQASVKCVGNADCARQSDPAICAKLGCQNVPFCDGEVDCTSFTIDECHEHLGCRFEW